MKKARTNIWRPMCARKIGEDKIHNLEYAGKFCELIGKKISNSLISRALSGATKQTYDYQLWYADQPAPPKLLFKYGEKSKQKKRVAEIKRENRKICARKIGQKRILTFKNAYKLYESTGAFAWFALHGIQKTCGGYQVWYANKPAPKPVYEHRGIKPVEGFINGKWVRFESSTEAARKVRSYQPLITRVCMGDGKTASKDKNGTPIKWRYAK